MTNKKKLSDKQKEYFAKSKVRDVDGGLLKLYHGSGTKIDAFDENYTGLGNDQYGSGFYFTSDYETALGYTEATRRGVDGKEIGKLGGEDSPNVIEAYINVTKPFIIDGNEYPNLSGIKFSTEQARAIIEKFPSISSLTIDENPLWSFYEELWSLDELTHEVLKPYAERFVNDYYSQPSLDDLDALFKDYPNELRRAVYDTTENDGVIINFEDGSRHVVAWFPEQIKSTSNLEPVKSKYLNDKASEDSSHKNSNKNTLVVNLFGGPGAGKTTAAHYLVYELKKAGYETEFVGEYAKELIYAENSKLLDGTYENELYIAQEKKRRLDVYNGKVDVIVTDGPIMASAIYYNENELNSDLDKRRFGFALMKYHNQFNNTSILVSRGLDNEYDERGRIHTEEQSIVLDTKNKEFLEKTGMKYKAYDRETLESAVKNVINELEKTNKRKHKEQSATLEDMKNSVSIVEYGRDVLGFSAIKEGRGMMRLEKHDSCKVYPNNTYYRFSTGKGGSIIDFIMEFENVSLKAAIMKVTEYYNSYNPEFLGVDSSFNSKTARFNSDYSIEVPPKDITNRNVYAYLTKTRGISPEVVNEYIDRNILYQDEMKNCVWIGKLDDSILYATKRGTKSNSTYKGDVAGSTKEVGIYFNNKGAKSLVLTESAIDQMSYMTMDPNAQQHSYLSACGAANAESALKIHMRKRKEAKNIKEIIFALDNDEAGETNTLKAAAFIKENYPEIQCYVNIPKGKDFNEDLLQQREYTFSDFVGSEVEGGQLPDESLVTDLA